MKILIFIDHDIIVRNFLHCGAFEELCRRHEVAYVFPDPASMARARLRCDVHALGLTAPVSLLASHPERRRLWSKLFHVSRLRWRTGSHHRAVRRLVLAAIGPGHWREYRALALPLVYPWFERRTLKTLAAIPNRNLEALIDAEKPDVLLHPTALQGPLLHDLWDVAKRRGLTMVTVMNSWDNPALKPNAFMDPGWFLVWGEQTRRHALRYMNVTPKRVVSFGAAQLDVHLEPPEMTRAEFCRDHGIDPAKTLVLYAGSNLGSDEASHLAVLDDAIADGRLGDAHVVYRPHPWGLPASQAARILDHPWRHVTVDASLSGFLREAREKDGLMALPEYRHTRNVLASVDAVISPLSTMIIEATLHGKPTICYLPDDEDVDFYQRKAHLAHFDEIYDMPEFLKARGRNELPGQTRVLLDRAADPKTAARLKEIATFFVEPFERPFRERIVDFVEQVAAGVLKAGTRATRLVPASSGIGQARPVASPGQPASPG